jgi:putative nucleotidyltransferase with HDIG domain
MAPTHDDPAMAVHESDLLTARALLEQTYSDELRFPGSPITPELFAISLQHVERVRQHAREIASGEGLDANLLDLAAILHDISKLDHREASSGGIDTWHHHARGASLARKILLVDLHKPMALADRVAALIETHSDIPFIQRFWSAHYHSGLPAPTSKEQIALRDADAIDLLWVGGMAKIVYVRQMPGSDFFKEDGRDIQKAIASARRSFDEAADILRLPTARRLATQRIETVQSFFHSLAHIRSLPEFVRVYECFEHEHATRSKASAGGRPS